jgi:hypothetical protein
MSGSTSRNSRRHAASEAEAISRIVQRLREQFPEVPPDALEEVVHGLRGVRRQTRARLCTGFGRAGDARRPRSRDRVANARRPEYAACRRA